MKQPEPLVPAAIPIRTQAVSDALNPEMPIRPQDRMAIFQHLGINFLRGPILEIGEGGVGVKQKVEIKPPPGGTHIGPGRYRCIPELYDGPEIIERPDWEDPPEWIEEKQAIIDALNEFWDFTGLHPLPRKWPTCLCGYKYAWLVRYWSYHDYQQTTGDPSIHKFRYRVDVSMKCQKCAFVGIWGVIVPDSWWEEREIKMDRINWKEAPAEFQAEIKTRLKEASEREGIE